MGIIIGVIIGVEQQVLSAQILIFYNWKRLKYIYFSKVIYTIFTNI